MPEEFKYLELIEQYCEGNLNAEDSRAFENQLLVDEKLKDEFDLYKNIVQSMNSIKVDSIRAKLKEIDEEPIDSERIRKSRFIPFSNRRFFAIAASIIVVLGLAYLVFFSWSNDRMIASYELEEPGLPVLMGDETATSFDEAMNAYKLNDLDKSLSILYRIEAKKPDNDTAIYFIGVILARQNKINAALPYLINVSNNPRTRFKQKAMYHLGISYWKENELESARDLFMQLSNDKDSPYSENAKRILRQL